MAKTAIVSGAGSGVGRAVALELARDGWNIGLLGRRQQPLRQTIELAGELVDRFLPVPCDVSQATPVHEAVAAIEQKFGPVQGLVAAAGVNVPNRAWEALNQADFHRVVETNLAGTFNCVHEVLPSMRRAGGGTIVAIVSDAGVLANSKAGAAYVASKFGQRGLIQSINCEERGNGIRATAICPGDINTPLLDKRPVPPSAQARAQMLQPEDIAACVMLAINLPPRAIVEELLVRPR